VQELLNVFFVSDLQRAFYLQDAFVRFASSCKEAKGEKSGIVDVLAS